MLQAFIAVKGTCGLTLASYLILWTLSFHNRLVPAYQSINVVWLFFLISNVGTEFAPFIFLHGTCGEFDGIKTRAFIVLLVLFLPDVFRTLNVTLLTQRMYITCTSMVPDTELFH